MRASKPTPLDIMCVGILFLIVSAISEWWCYMGIEDVPKRRRVTQQRSRGIPISTETLGSLMVLFGFFVAGFCSFLNSDKLRDGGIGVGALVIAVGVVLSIGGKKR